MKKTLFFLLAGVAVGTAQAQLSEQEENNVILPAAAQKCVLPAAPDAIPEEADYDQLVAAKGQVSEFQAGLLVYRECLGAAETGSDDLTAGNKQALVASYNYSVEMEERVAARFNEAIRSYKERTAKN